MTDHAPGCSTESLDACDCRGTPAPAHWGRTRSDRVEAIRRKLRDVENARARAKRARLRIARAA